MILKKNTPYMIRNDGEVFECGSIHPYILHDVHNRFYENMRVLFISYPEWVLWFYNNTNIEQTKKKIKEAIQYLANAIVSKDPENLIYMGIGIEKISYIKEILDTLNIVAKPFDDPIDQTTIDTIINYFEQINSLTNQEFLRMRTGGEYTRNYTQDIYFRVSSIQFNWFDIIWQLVFENKTIIDKVTIETDRQSGKRAPFRYYVLGGEEVKRLDVNIFLTLKDNPIVESLPSDNIKIQKLRNGLPLLEALGDYGPLHNVAMIEAYRDVYVQEAFGLNKLNEAQQKLMKAVIKEALENPEGEEKTPLTLHELLRELGINKTGTYSDNSTYTIDLTDSNDYGRINSTLDRSNLLDPIDESSYVTADNANLDYKYQDQFILSLIADFEEDYYQLVITEMEE